MTVGILAIQGSIIEHKCKLEQLGIKVKLIKKKEDLQGIAGCVIPGGESTTIMLLLKEYGLDVAIQELSNRGLPIYGTCAGLIVLKNLGLLDVQLERNGYGSQLHSFEADIVDINNDVDVKYDLKVDDKAINVIKGVFIRAPKITGVGDRVVVLAKHKGSPVLMQQDNILASSFHPELVEENHVYKYFLRMISV